MFKKKKRQDISPFRKDGVTVVRCTPATKKRDEIYKQQFSKHWTSCKEGQ